MILSLRERYREAIFQGRLRTGDWSFKLVQPLNGSDRAHVKRKNIPLDLRIPGPGRPLKIFLVHQTVDAKNWIAELWDEHENPWLTDQIPRMGSIVTGTVARMVGTQRVVVELDDPARPFSIEAWLARNNLPDPQPGGSMHGLLDLGDRVAAEIAGINELDLAIDLNCREAVRRLRSDAERRNATDANPAFWSRLAENRPRPPKPAPQRLEGKTVIVFDDDEGMATVFAEWAQRYGATFKSTRKIRQLEAFLGSAMSPFVLIDFNGVEYEQAVSLSKAYGARVAMWSGDERARAVAATLGVAFEQKPTTLSRITDLINEREPLLAASDAPGVQREGTLWTGRRTTGKVTSDAYEYLEKFRSRQGLRAVLWLRREHEQVFSVQTSVGKLSQENMNDVMRELWRSVVTSAVPEFEERISSHSDDEGNPPILNTGPVPRLDPIQKLFADRGDPELHYAAYCIQERDAKLRLIIFVNKGPIKAPLSEVLRHEYDHLQHLLQLFRVTEHLDAIEDFAKVGRLYSATLHELKNDLQTNVFLPGQIAESLRVGDIDTARARAESLGKGLDTMLQIATTDLEQVRKLRVERTDINALVEQLIERMNDYRRITLRYNRTRVTARLDPKLNSLAVSLSPIILEQPLVNLIDNALYHTGDHPWGRVEVETKLTDEPERPLHIYVRDNGRGISATGATSLFEPRESTKTGLAGTGMGLFASRNIVVAAGGQLECTERLLWLGATFCIRLPVLLGEAKQEPERDGR